MSDFENLYCRYAPDVFRFALYLCADRAEAEDIASETFHAQRPVRPRAASARSSQPAIMPSPPSGVTAPSQRGAPRAIA